MDSNELQKMTNNLPSKEVGELIKKAATETFETGKKLGGFLSDIIDDIFA